MGEASYVVEKPSISGKWYGAIDFEWNDICDGEPGCDYDVLWRRMPDECTDAQKWSCRCHTEVNQVCVPSGTEDDQCTCDEPADNPYNIVTVAENQFELRGPEQDASY